ncbi:hypothetical protein BDQ17DRAFT_1332255 [Cyathus striatus]|nr:hypothetical protein BDQ17DRAFT_1332255 [Cyathus striatus]
MGNTDWMYGALYCRKLGTRCFCVTWQHNTLFIGNAIFSRAAVYPSSFINYACAALIGAIGGVTVSALPTILLNFMLSMSFYEHDNGAKYEAKIIWYAFSSMQAVLTPAIVATGAAILKSTRARNVGEFTVEYAAATGSVGCAIFVFVVYRPRCLVDYFPASLCMMQLCKSNVAHSLFGICVPAPKTWCGGIGSAEQCVLPRFNMQASDLEGKINMQWPYVPKKTRVLWVPLYSPYVNHGCSERGG